MALPDELQSILIKNNGTITTAQANDAGFSNERLRLLVKSGNLEQDMFGVYIAPDTFFDKMYAAQLRRPKIIYSHESALFLHDLSDRDPIEYTVTVPTRYNTERLKEDGFKTYTIKQELHEVGVTQLKTIFSNTIAVYNMERTICDTLRSRNRMEIAIVTDAMKMYVRRKDKHLGNLMEMAEMFKVTKLLRKYLEVLL